MRYFRAFGLILLLLTGSAYACGEEYSGWDYGCCDSCGCGIEIGVEYLYMLSSITQPYYVIDDTGGVTTVGFAGKRRRNEQGWHSGYRVDASAICCGCDHIRGRWTHLPPFTDRHSNDLTEGYPILNHPAGSGTATFSSIRDRFVYYSAELLYGRPVYCCHGLILTLEAGLVYTFLELKEDVDYVSTIFSAAIHNHSRIHGVGPELNFAFEYCLPCDFSLVGQFTGALLMSKKETSTRNRTTLGTALPLNFNTKDHKYWISTPTYDARLGLGYDACWDGPCFGLGIHLEAGYEFIRVTDGINRIYFVDDTNIGSSFNEYMAFTLSGPYFRLALTF